MTIAKWRLLGIHRALPLVLIVPTTSATLISCGGENVANQATLGDIGDGSRAVQPQSASHAAHATLATLDSKGGYHAWIPPFDPPSPPNVSCKAVSQSDNGKCRGPYPDLYVCPSPARPVGCVGAGVLLGAGKKGVCCK
jgi:hypothetical protein